MHELTLERNGLSDVILAATVIGIAESRIHDVVLHVKQKGFLAEILLAGRFE
jgi:hypothetical protein